MRINIRLVAGLLLCAALPAGCRRAESSQKPIKPVQVQEVQLIYPGGETGEGERYSANIMPGSQIELSFKNGGLLTQIHQVRGPDGRMRYIQEGDRAPKGAVLARLRNEDFAAKVTQAEAQLTEAQTTVEANRAQLSEAEAGLRQAERDLDRAAKLIETRSLTKPEYEGAKTKVELAQARVEAIRAQGKVIQAKIAGAQALLGEAKLAERDGILTAPIDCYILRRMAEPGALIPPGRPLFVVAERSSVKAIFGVPDLSLKNVKIGVPLTFTTEAIPGIEFKGWVSRISPAADPKAASSTSKRRSAILRINFGSGMIASLTLPTVKSAAPVTVVPINAIVRPKQNPQSYAVNIVTAQGGKQVVQQRTVKLGDAYGNMIAVTEGVSLGDKVVISGAAMMVDGEEVRVIQ